MALRVTVKWQKNTGCRHCEYRRQLFRGAGIPTTGPYYTLCHKHYDTYRQHQEKKEATT